MDDILLELSKQGLAGLMLAIFVMAIIWLAKTFKASSDDHKKEIISIYEKTIVWLRDERDVFTRVVDDNTKAINNLAERLNDLKDKK